jgi:hypothetical protein
MKSSERKHRTTLYTSNIFQFTQCIISYLIREISAYCELISCTTELAQFHRQSVQIRWLVLTQNCAYSQLTILNTNFHTSLITQFHNLLINSLCQRQFHTFNVFSAVSAVLPLRYTEKQREHNKY